MGIVYTAARFASIKFLFKVKIMSTHRIRSIDVQVFGNDITIEVKGEFMDDRYVLDNIELTSRNGGIDLTILSHLDGSKPATDDLLPFRKTIPVTDLKPGVYYIRIDNNNNWVKWCKIASHLVHTINLGQL
jgi:hypothetical protein